MSKPPLALSTVARRFRVQLQVILTGCRQSRIEAALIASRECQREVIALDRPAGISVVFTARRPVLIAELLAERLYLRDPAGRALSMKAVTRRLCKR